jgi:16S rRNA processing protein RimM
MYVDSDHLPVLEAGTYYQFQLIGMTVRTEEGTELGRIANILETGARDVYVVSGRRGEILLPAIEEVVREVDLAAGVMTVRLLPGLEEAEGGSGGRDEEDGTDREGGAP